MSSLPVTLRVVEPADRAGWEAFTARADGTEIGHLWELHDLLARVFHLTVVRLAAVRGSEWVGVLPLVLQKSFLGRFLTSVPYLNYGGVLAQDPGARQALARQAVELAGRLDPPCRT